MATTTTTPSDSGLPPDVTGGYTLLATAWTGAAISLIFVVLRLWSRSLVSRALGWDDAVVTFGWVLNVASLACCTMAVKYGLGRHLVYLSEHELNMTLYWSTILQPMGVYSYCFPKLAVVLLLVKLMMPTKGVRYALYGLMVLLFICSFLAVLFLFVRCTPMDHFWHPLEPADCMPASVLNGLTALAGSVSALCDLILAVFPIKVVLGLQMKLSRKLGISALMGLGILAMIAAIAKTSMLHKESSPDATYVLIPLLITHYVEVNLVIICATAPSVPALFKKLRGQPDSQASGYLGNPTPTFGQSGGSKGYRPFESQESAIGLHTVDNMHREPTTSKQGSTSTGYIAACD